MGQKVNPVGFRLGIYRNWDSRWFARKSYGKEVLEDFQIRKFLSSALKNAEISKIEIEKAGDDNMRITLHSGRPGIVIGKRGADIDSLRTELARHWNKKNVEVSVQEVKTPEIDAVLVAKDIAEQLVKRGSFKKAMKRAAIAAMKAGAKGIKICCSGRLNGAEIAREEWTRVGSIPLHTIRAKVDYGFAEALTTYGLIGVKVWICTGEYQQAGY
ncbi:MAG: hypothetical protein AMXMBFR12_05610 [Candidatus Babeliales bacterium]